MTNINPLKNNLKIFSITLENLRIKLLMEKELFILEMVDFLKEILLRMKQMGQYWEF
jgi:hypothetical protein